MSYTDVDEMIDNLNATIDSLQERIKLLEGTPATERQIELARYQNQSPEVQIDDDARFSGCATHGHYWVSGWVYVKDEEDIE